MLEMRFKIVERLDMKEMLGCFSEVVAPLAPIGCNFDGSVDEFIFIDDFIDGTCVSRFFCIPNLILKEKLSASLLTYESRQKPGCSTIG